MSRKMYTEEEAMKSLADYEAFLECKSHEPRLRELWEMSKLPENNDPEKQKAIDAERKSILDGRQEKENALRKAILPFVGMGCTIIYYSDRRAATVTKILSPCRIEVTHNKTICKDWYAGDYEILPELEEAFKDVFTKRTNGLWVKEGHPSRDGVVLALTYQSHYIDPCY